MSATYAFCSDDKLGYSAIENFLGKCKNVTNFNSACRAIKFTDNTNINLNTIFAQNSVVNNVSYMFGSGGFGPNDLPAKTNNVRITGTLPSSVTNAFMMFFGNGST